MMMRWYRRWLEEDEFGVMVSPALCVRSRRGSERSTNGQYPDPKMVHSHSAADLILSIYSGSSHRGELVSACIPPERYRKDAK